MPTPAKAPSAGAKLTCGSGPAKGQEFILAGDEAIIGRSAENAVSIPDTSVSRRHVQLVQAVGGWRAKDLGSGNGTLLNGDKLEGEVPLRNGDTLTLGHTELTFVDLANNTDRVEVPATGLAKPRVVPPRPGPPRPAGSRPGSEGPRRASGNRPESRVRVSRQMKAVGGGLGRKARLIVLGLLLVLTTAGTLLAVLKVRLDKRTHQRQQMVSDQRLQREKVGEILQAGKHLARDGKWREALVKFQEVERLDPTFPELKSYLDKAPKEVEVQVKLDSAQAAMTAGKLAEAAELLAQANSGTGLYNPRLKSLQRSMEGKLAPRLAEAKQALADNNLEAARELSADLLKVTPDNREAQIVLENAEKGLVSKHPVQRETVRKTSEPKLWEPALERFMDGDLAGAAGLANGCAAANARCKALVKDFHEFAELHKKLDDLDPRGLRRLVQLDHEISDARGLSKLARPAGIRLAGTLYKQASAAKAAGDWAKAKDLAKQVLAADPSNAGAAAILEESSKKAKELYLYGYSNKESNVNEALKAFRQVIEITTSDDELHRKALSQVEKLSR